MLCDWEGKVSTRAWLVINSACQVIKYLPLSPCRGAGMQGAGAYLGRGGVHHGQAASSLKGQYTTTTIHISAYRLS